MFLINDVMTDIKQEQIKALVRSKLNEKIPSVLKKVDVASSSKIIAEAKKFISEAAYIISKPFVLKTEKLSSFTKENHFKLYQNYVDSLNKISTKIDTLDKNIDSLNPNDSEFRRLKLNEQHNANGVKLHELYFANISDLTSAIRADSIPYMHLSKDFGTFEQWQFDFRACAMAATEGWAICYYDPHCKKYLNCIVEKHSEHLPVMGIPVIVLDTWHHAWYKDYLADKKGYVNGMMVELNWAVIEQRMLVAERSNLDQIYGIQPVMSSGTETIVTTSQPVNVAPISPSQPPAQQPIMGPAVGLTPTPAPLLSIERPAPAIKEGKK
jgi:Fe-Mn family superoxide dismutase